MLRSDKATCLNCGATLASGRTSKDDTASASAVEEVGGASGTLWSATLRPKKAAMSHVGNGAVNGSTMRTTSQIAESFESTMFGDGSYKISTRQPSPHGPRISPLSLTKTNRTEPGIANQHAQKK